MKKLNKKILFSSIIAFIAAVMLVGLSGCYDIAERPVIFVHGYSGSGAQFESQAIRFTSNGYPADYIAVHEYDSTMTLNTMEDIHAGLDLLIDGLLEKTGADKVDIAGHSMGTTVMHAYLAFPERARKVAHYVNIDGASSDSPPGGVPTLALWAGIRPPWSPDGEITGALNITIPDTTHVEVATCSESFYEMFRFFNGVRPLTTKILPEPGRKIKLAGKVVDFPQNVAPASTTLKIYEIDADTGSRIGKKPKRVYIIGDDAAWGPFKARAGRHYEFVLEREALGLPNHHFYREAFIRSDYLIRLNTSPPGGIGDYMDRSENHSNIVVSRDKEFWGDQGDSNDILKINGVNIVNEFICPIDKNATAIFVYDVGSDGISDLTQPTFYSMFPFLTGVDFYIPGAFPPDSTTSIELTGRSTSGKTRVINIPNWASSDIKISVIFNDFAQ